VRTIGMCAVLFVLGLLAGCGGDDSDEPDGDKARPGPAAPAGPTTNVTVRPARPSRLKWEKDRLRVPAGRLAITLDNVDDDAHNVRIATGTKCCFRSGYRDVGGTSTLDAGGKATATVDLERGEYVFVCTIGGHWQRGMWGRLTVE
jgi:plastocyanin